MAQFQPEPEPDENMFVDMETPVVMELEVTTEQLMVICKRFSSFSDRVIEAAEDELIYRMNGGDDGEWDEDDEVEPCPTSPSGPELRPVHAEDRPDPNDSGIMFADGSSIDGMSEAVRNAIIAKVNPMEADSYRLHKLQAHCRQGGKIEFIAHPDKDIRKAIDSLPEPFEIAVDPNAHLHYEIGRQAKEIAVLRAANAMLTSTVENTFGQRLPIQ